MCTTMCLVPKEVSRREHQIPWNEVEGGCESPCGANYVVLGTEPESSARQQVLLTTEPSL